MGALGLGNTIAAEGFQGGVFPTSGGESWVELWAPMEGMPEGVMLHLVFDDAEAAAAGARSAGIEVSGPHEAHGERIWHAALPGGLSCALISKAAPGP